jgi:hypothetical protein
MNTLAFVVNPKSVQSRTMSSTYHPCPSLPAAPCPLPVPQMVLEGSAPSVAVTSPAAAIALALMYLRTNDKEIAAR